MEGPYALFVDDSQYNLVSHTPRVLPIKARLPKNIYDDEIQTKEFSKYEDEYICNKDFRKLFLSVKTENNYNVYMKGGMSTILMEKIIRYVKHHPVRYIFLDWDFTIQRNNGTPLNNDWDKRIKLSTILREHHTNIKSYLEFIIGKERLPVFRNMLLELKKNGVRIVILTANGIPNKPGGKKFMADILNAIAKTNVISKKDVYYSQEKQDKIDVLLREFDEKLYCKTSNLTKKHVKKARAILMRPIDKTRKKKRGKLNKKTFTIKVVKKNT
jgi:hypothetical protein